MNRRHAAGAAPFFPRVLVACMLPVVLVACGSGAADPSASANAQTAPAVRTAPARAADEALVLNLPARAVASESALIYSRATGVVAERRVDLGDQVRPGQVLAIVATPEVDQDVRETQASLSQANADLALAQANYERAAKLVNTQFISGEAFNERAATRDAARANRDAVAARLASNRERQAFQVVRAPFAGVITARNVERGDRVVGDQATATAMFALDALDPLRIQVDVPQSAVLTVRPGLHAQVRFPELAGQQFSAEVMRSAQRISEQAGGMRVELRLPNPDARIPAGMVGEVALQVPRNAPVVLVPISAVLQNAGGARVAVVNKQSQLQYRSVQLGRNLGDTYEIAGGITAGEAVVLAPNALLADGAKVTVTAPPAAAAPPAGASPAGAPPAGSASNVGKAGS